MATTIAVALVVLGLAIGFIIAWVLGAGVTMNLIIGILLIAVGVIVGYVIEWLVDEAVRKNRELQRQLDAQRSAPFAAQTSAASIQGSDTFHESEAVAEALRQHKEELHQLSEQISAKDTQVEALRRELEVYQQTHPDDLTQIKGIGKVYQRKLRDIGFSSFKQLADADPDQIRRMLGIKEWQRVDVSSWVQQARDWAQHV
jgi:predicted flap endonuclease-1-like 5' DNA nuclease